jgi:hypothetical protein
MFRRKLKLMQLVQIRLFLLNLGKLMFRKVPNSGLFWRFSRFLVQNMLKLLRRMHIWFILYKMSKLGLLPIK